MKPQDCFHTFRDTEKQLNVNPWKCVAGNKHYVPHAHFTKHDAASRHVCFATPTNTSLWDHVMTVTVFNFISVILIILCAKL